jgi:hypothetical protein
LLADLCRAAFAPAASGADQRALFGVVGVGLGSSATSSLRVRFRERPLADDPPILSANCAQWSRVVDGCSGPSGASRGPRCPRDSKLPLPCSPRFTGSSKLSEVAGRCPEWTRRAQSVLTGPAPPAVRSFDHTRRQGRRHNGRGSVSGEVIVSSSGRRYGHGKAS